MRRRLALLFTIAAAATGAGSAAPGTAPYASAAAPAKTCSANFVRAVIGGAAKCLHAGEYCAHRYDREYRRYGFQCTRRDRRGRYHLSET